MAKVNDMGQVGITLQFSTHAFKISLILLWLREALMGVGTTSVTLLLKLEMW